MLFWAYNAQLEPYGGEANTPNPWQVTPYSTKCEGISHE